MQQRVADADRIATAYLAGTMSAAEAIAAMIGEAIVRNVSRQLARRDPRPRPPRRPVRMRRRTTGRSPRRRRSSSTSSTRASPDGDGAAAPIIERRPVPPDPYGFTEGLEIESIVAVDVPTTTKGAKR